MQVHNGPIHVHVNSVYSRISRWIVEHIIKTETQTTNAYRTQQHSQSSHNITLYINIMCNIIEFTEFRCYFVFFNRRSNRSCWKCHILGCWRWTSIPKPRSSWLRMLVWCTRQKRPSRISRTTHGNRADDAPSFEYYVISTINCNYFRFFKPDNDGKLLLNTIYKVKNKQITNNIIVISPVNVISIWSGGVDIPHFTNAHIRYNKTIRRWEFSPKTICVKQ